MLWGKKGGSNCACSGASSDAPARCTPHSAGGASGRLELRGGEEGTGRVWLGAGEGRPGRTELRINVESPGRAASGKGSKRPGRAPLGAGSAKPKRAKERTKIDGSECKRSSTAGAKPD